MRGEGAPYGTFAQPVYRFGGGFAQGGPSAVSHRRRFLEGPSRMRSVLALAIAAAVSTGGLVACSGSHSASTAIPRTPQSTQTHVRHVKGARTKQDFSGTAPFNMTLMLFDAPLVGLSGSNAKFNAGILGVD